MASFNWSGARNTPSLEVLNATSSVFTPTGTGHWHQLSNNSVALTAGTWEMSAGGFFTNSGALAYSEVGVGIYGANGANSGSNPTLLTATSNLTVNSVFATSIGGLNMYINATLSSLSVIHTQNIIVTASTGVTLYAVTYSAQNTAANARVTAYLTARKIY